MFQAIEREISPDARLEGLPRKSGDFFENVFICHPDAILILDNECIPTITDCNPAAEKMYGYGRQELVGQSVNLLHAKGEISKQFRESIISSVHEQGFCYFTGLWMRRYDGTFFPCDYTVAPLSEGRKQFGWISIAHDITERIEAEKFLRESAEKIKRFAYSTCHDLKNPSIALRLFAQRLADRYGPFLDEQGNMCCERIRRASQEIVLLVDRLYEYISTKELPISIDSIDLDEVLQDVQEEFLQQARTLGVRFSVSRCPVTLSADRMCLVRALRNLIENALTHGGDGLSEISLGYLESDEFHIISVRDDGVGLTDEDSEEIFELFRRGRQSKTIPGAGLGLGIVREIAARHGGSVSIGPGPGAEFLLSIPKRLQLITQKGVWDS